MLRAPFAGLVMLRSSERRIEDTDLTGTGPVAVVFTIADEDPPAVFARVEATYQSLQTAGELERFDFHVLSESTDPDRRVAEEVAWSEARRRLDAPGRMFYRHRAAHSFARFCRTRSGDYRYAISIARERASSAAVLLHALAALEAHRDLSRLDIVPATVATVRLYEPVFPGANDERHHHRVARLEILPERRRAVLLVPDESTTLPVPPTSQSAPPAFIDALVDPAVNAMHLRLLGRRARRAAADRLSAKLLEHGPTALSDAEKMEILEDPQTLRELHAAVWSGAAANWPERAS